MNDQPRSGEDVSKKDQPPKPENVGQRPAGMGDAAAYDIMAELQTPISQTPGETPSAGDKKDDDVPPEEKSEGEEQKKSEEQKPEEKKETPPEETSKKEGEEPFATVGNQTFKNKEEMIDFLSSQLGYNRWLTGAIREAHPDWFDEKGKLLPKKINKAEAAVEEIGDAAQKAAQGLKLNNKEKEVLRNVGLVFAEDIERIVSERMKERPEKNESSEIDQFEKDHPLFKNHYDEVYEILESTKNLPAERQVTLAQAWSIVKERHGIKEGSEKSQTSDPHEEEKKKKTGLDTQIPSSPTPQTGAPPMKNNKDYMDDVLGAVGIG